MSEKYLIMRKNIIVHKLAFIEYILCGRKLGTMLGITHTVHTFFFLNPQKCSRDK